MLFFMWGVFRGRRSNCSNSMEKSTVPSLSVVPLDKEIHSVVSASENDGLTESEDKETTVYDSSCNMASELNASIKSNGDSGKKASSTHATSEKQDSKLDFKPLSKIAIGNELLCKEVKCTSSSVEEVGLPVMRQDTRLEPSVQANGTKNGSSEGEAIEKHGDASHVKILGVGNLDLCVKGSDKEKVVDGMGSDRGGLVRDLNDENVNVDAEAHLKEGDLTVKEINCWQSYNGKRPYLDLSETAPQNSGSTNHKTLWNKVDSMLVNGESIGKKLKTGVSEPYGCSGLKDGNSRSDGLCSHIGDLGSSSSEEMMCDKVSDKKVIFEDSRTTEMSFFPLGLPDTKDLPLGSSSKLWRGYSSNNEDRLLDGTPNLELALGAETKSQYRGIRSLLGENNVPNKTTVDKATDKEEDSVPASLSLSLSFPFSDKETSVKPVPKPEQILQGRPPVNTSLLLFGGFSDK